MKNLFLAAALLMTTNAFAIEFDLGAPVNASAINLTITDHVINFATGSITFKDESDKPRLIADPSTYSLTIQYLNSAGVSVYESNSYSGADSTSTILLMLKSATKNCPVKLQLARETRRIVKMAAQCDVLASADLEDNQG